MIKVILFDLDGTLLQMDQDLFIKTYFGGLVKKLVPLGYDKDTLVKGIWAGTGAMVNNDGKRTNEKVFWDTFVKICGDKIMNDISTFDDFYANDFDGVSIVAEKKTDAPWAVNEIKKMGYRIALATNPVFPAIATQKRTRWAGLSVDAFELYTSYENSRFCKPNQNYYKDILTALGVNRDECLMVGNDVNDDMVCEEYGMKVFLITKYLINPQGKDISHYPQGDFHDLVNYVSSLGEK